MAERLKRPENSTEDPKSCLHLLVHLQNSVETPSVNSNNILMAVSSKYMCQRFKDKHFHWILELSKLGVTKDPFTFEEYLLQIECWY